MPLVIAAVLVEMGAERACGLGVAAFFRLGAPVARAIFRSLLMRLLAVAMLASLPEIYDVPHAALFAL